MSLSDRTRGILVQVAFKEAAEDARRLDSAPSVQDNTEGYFNLLLNLFAKYDIQDDEKPTRRSSGSKPKRPSAQDDAPIVTIDGVEYYDFRGLKAIGAVKERHPDFKAVTGGSSKWLQTQDGDDTQFATLVETAGV